jgi:hypothetical protein
MFFIVVFAIATVVVSGVVSAMQPNGLARHDNLHLCVSALWNAGTLDPVRNLTGLTHLDVGTNQIGGMPVLVQRRLNGGACVEVLTPVGLGYRGDCKYVVWCRSIAGTLDPLRNLTRLTHLDVSSNALLGMFPHIYCRFHACEFNFAVGEVVCRGATICCLNRVSELGGVWALTEWGVGVWVAYAA